MPRTTTVSTSSSTSNQLTMQQMEQWLWDAACVIRGSTDAPKYKDFILPLVFYKRLCDVFEDEFAAQVEYYGDEETARQIVSEDHDAALKEGRDSIVRFFVPEECSWSAIRNHPADSKLGEFVTTCLRTVAGLNPDLKGVLDVKDFAETQAGQRTLEDDRLASLVEVISRHRLGLKDTKPDILGHAYEYLLRKFAEGQGQSAGEFYTPSEVALMMARVIDPPPKATIYDPTCGSGGLLVKARIAFEQKHPDKKSQAPKLYGQELNATTYAIARMNMILHDCAAAKLLVGDTFRTPGFGAKGAGLQQFDRVVANPMWNQKNYDDGFYENDPWSRFTYGLPPAQSADWGWVQHILASLKAGGRAAVVLDTGAVSRGSGSDGSNRERAIRKALVEADVVEGVILLPENMFYNTNAPGIVLILSAGKPLERHKQILMVNVSRHFVKQRPKNVLTTEGIDAATLAFSSWSSFEKLSKVVTIDEIRGADYNLSPTQFIEVEERRSYRPLAEIIVDLDIARGEREAADTALSDLLDRLALMPDAES